MVEECDRTRESRPSCPPTHATNTLMVSHKDRRPMIMLPWLQWLQSMAICAPLARQCGYSRCCTAMHGTVVGFCEGICTRWSSTYLLIAPDYELLKAFLLRAPKVLRGNSAAQDQLMNQTARAESAQARRKHAIRRRIAHQRVKQWGRTSAYCS